MKPLVISITMWGKLVGAMSYVGAQDYCVFEYAPDWLDTGIEISPIHLPLSRKKYTFPQLPRATFKGLPAVFADTLPDDFGNAVINAWLARQGRDVASFSSLERLLYTGRRGMGALEFEPAIRKKEAEREIEVDGLVQMAQHVINQRQEAMTKIGESSSDLSALLQVGTSAGGARAKAIIAINDDRSAIRSGQVDAPKGFSHWLLKLDGVSSVHQSQETFGDPQGFGRMEFAYYLMAKDAGIDMSPCELLLEGERAHFMTQRFDRVGNEKRHYQSLCAMDHADFKQPGHYSYEQLFQVMRQLRLPRREALQMFRRMVFNIMARNHDDHSKNFGFMLNDENRWQLAPAFDVAYSYKKDSPWVNTHQLSLNGKRTDFTQEDLLLVAATFKKEAKAIIQHTKEVVKSWPHYAQLADVAPEFSQLIGENHVFTV